MGLKLAWANLCHHRLRTLVGTAGVSFATMLVLMQLGFLGAVSATATLIYSALDFDLVVRSPTYLHLAEPRRLPMARLDQALTVPGVERVVPLDVGMAEWQSPTSGQWRGILMLGVEPNSPPFFPSRMQGLAQRLVNSRDVAIDQASRRDFGPANGEVFGAKDRGVRTRLGAIQVRIADVFHLGTGLAANGALMINREGFQAAVPDGMNRQASLGLVQLTPQASQQQVRDRLRQKFQSAMDVSVLSRQEVLDFERRRWVENTSVGTIFRVGVAVSLIVGLMIVFQVLSTDVRAMLAEYATLNAIGYTQRALVLVVVSQAAFYALLGFSLGLCLSWAGYSATSALSGVPMQLEFQRCLAVFVLIVLMCAVSGVLAGNRLRRVDPAELF